MARLNNVSSETIESLQLKYLDELRGFSKREISLLPGIDERAKEIIREVIKEHGRVWGEGTPCSLEQKT